MLTKLSDLNESMEKLHPHDHVCLIYENRKEWTAVISAFLKSGLKRGEKCIYIHHTHTSDQIRRYLHEEEVDVIAAEASRQLDIVPASEVYTKKDIFDPARTIALLTTKTKKATDKGYTALRVTGEMGWAANGCPGSEKLMEYESKLNKSFFKKNPGIALCLYNRRIFDPETLKNVIFTHPLLMMNNSVFQNFQYIPPEEFMNKKRSESELQHFLKCIEQYHESQEYMHFLLEMVNNSPHPLIAHSPDGRMITCNSAFCGLTGYSKEELSDTNLTAVLTPPEWRDLEAKVIHELHTTGKIQHYKKKIICKNGKSVPIDLYIKEMRSAEGRIKYYFSFITNIIESHRRGKAVAAEEQLEELKSFKEKPVEDFIKDLGHKSKEVRINAAWTLGMKQDERAVEALIQNLKDRSTDVRWTSAWALGEIKDERAVDHLNLAVRDRNIDVRRIAREALEKIKSKNSTSTTN